MKLHIVVLVTLTGLVAADEELLNKYQTMSKSTFIEYFNAQDYSWKMSEYDNIDEQYAACADFDEETMENLPLQIHDLEGSELPDNFDARQQWPHCETIKEIYDQGKCGSCWAFGAATPASDRTCIHKDVHVRLSEQDLQCLKKDACRGGSPMNAFKFWRDQGLVTDKCKPYDAEKLNKSEPCVTECVNSDINYKQDKHFGEKIHRISNESDLIKAELVKNGPIQATFIVYIDFKWYKSGIYTVEVPVPIGAHSVRVIGYGVEDRVNYWLVANSWGSSWGEKGLFRIKCYDPLVQFENYLITGMPKN